MKEMIEWSRHKAVRKTSAYPSVFDEDRFTLSDLSEAAAGAAVVFRGWPFIAALPGCPIDESTDALQGITDTTDLSIAPRISQWKLLRSGLFLHRGVMLEALAPPSQNKRILDVRETIYHVAEAVGSLWRLYRGLDVPYEERVTIEFTYQDTAGRELVAREAGCAGLSPGHISQVSKIEATRTLPLYSWRLNEVEVSVELSREIFRQFQWEPSAAQLEDEVGPLLGRKAPQASR